MRLVTNTDSIADWFGDKEAVKLIKDAGFDAADYSMFCLGSDASPLANDGWEDYVKDLKAYADSINFTFRQGHSPFPCYNRDDMAYTEKIVPRVRRSVEIAGMLGIENLVVHPVAPTQMPLGADLKEFNMEFYRSLLPLAEKWNVKICLENMWGYDSKRGYIIPNVCSFGRDLADYLDTLGDEHFTVCLDLGHSGLVGEDAADAIYALGGERLGALHVHDNDFKRDTHILPYYGKMDWNAITKALSDVGYKGDFTFEVFTFLKDLPHDEEIVLSALRYMHDMGRYLIKKIEG